MRTLVLLRGCPGVGKSTWIKESGLEQYTLSADNIRLLFQSPVLNKSGKYEISSKHDNKVWGLLFKLLESRMERGEFTIIDATHSKQSMISRYKPLAQKYRYRVYVVDFSDVDLQSILKRNKMRDEHKHVPESSIINIYDRMTREKVPSWVTVLKPDEFENTMSYKPRSFDEYKKIHIFGDIHGCNTVLQEYLNGKLKDNELYIFVGDLVDRGIENAQLLEFMIKIKDQKNVIILEGNHDRYINMYGHDEETPSSTFNNKTKPELDQANIDKKDIRQLARKFHQLVYFTYKGTLYIVTHGGVSTLPINLLMTATTQFINGVGDYSDDIDHEFTKNTAGQNIVQIHGHRNMYRLPVLAAERSYNLEGQVERGGHLRVVTLSENGVETHEVKNDVFKLYKTDKQINIETVKSIDEMVSHLRSHEYVQENKMPSNISSFNFTKQAFREKKWDETNVKARGLFINTESNEIVSRSYDKFFNIGERSETQMHRLVDTLKFPVSVYDKANGYLGTVGYDTLSDDLVFTSKSFTSAISNEHAKWVEDLFIKTFSNEQVSYIKEYLKAENVSLVFEVILPEKDPHIIEYQDDKLLLLDIVKRQITYDKLQFREVQALASKLSIESKKLVHTFDNWTDFYRWYLGVSEDYSIEEEGYVIEDAAGFMTKLKLPYYNYWKLMRKLKNKISNRNEHTINTGILQIPLHNKFLAWAKTKDRDYLRSVSVIKLRNDFKEEVMTTVTE
ncbi:RNA ligase [Bacillus halotolerans]|uniref:RNA ligase n=1 Tax=Bacillus halotolerans TaxID=260554 RepID=UPI00192CAB6B|nr:RNA ligase [Bacillus halotolerans]MBL4968953.1 metallophosphoesterase [Bacillus halotolerans]MBL4973016.1 metallophosphoesterase [Bacillus halotolerans]